MKKHIRAYKGFVGVQTHENRKPKTQQQQYS